MTDLQKELNHAFKLISAIPVSGDAVDVMAAARIRLREAFELAGDKSALWEAHKQEKAEKEKKDG